MRSCPACAKLYESDEPICPKCGERPRTVAGFMTHVADPPSAQPPEFDESTYRSMLSFEAHSFYIRSRFDLMYWAFRRYFPETKRFLDFGAGTGFWLHGLATRHPEIELYGSDLSLDSLKVMAHRLGGNAEIFQSDAESLPFEDHFDVIGSFDVIEHIDDDVGVLRALQRPLRAGGGLMLTVPQHMCMWSVLDDKTGHKRRYVGDELARKVRDAGYEVLLDTSFMATLFAPQYLSRRRMRGAPDSTPDTEHSLPGPVNALMRGALIGELAAIRAGMRFPFGGLRIVCARKP